MNKIMSAVKNEKGQGMVEYALIIALISIALVGALTALKTGVSGTFSQIVANF